MQDFLPRYDRIQRLNATRPDPAPVVLDKYYSRHNDELCRGGNPISSVVLVLFGVAAGLVLMPVLKACDKPPQPQQASCTTCHNINTYPQPQLLTYKSYRLFYSRLIREI